MAGTTGAGGLSALGWSAVAAGAAALGGVVLYVAGVFDPAVEPVDEIPPVEEVAVLPSAEPAPTTEPDPEVAPVTQPVEAEEDPQPEASPASEPAEAEAEASETDAQPEIAAEPEQPEPATPSSESGQDDVASANESEAEDAEPKAGDDNAPQTEVATAAEPEAVEAEEQASEPVAEAPVASAGNDADVVADTSAAGSTDEGVATPSQDSASVAEPTETEPTESAEQPADQPADVASNEAPVTTETPVEDQAPILLAPSFDVVRVEPDGTTLVAGSGTEGSTVTILLDGTRIDEFDILPGGQFVSFLDIGISNAPRVLTMRAVLGDVTVLSADSIIIAPAPQPVATDDDVAPSEDVAALDEATPEAPTQTPAAEPQEPAAEAEPDQEPVAQDTAQPVETDVVAEDVVDARPETSTEEQTPVASDATETDEGATSTAVQEDVAESAVEAEPTPSEPAAPQPVAVIRAGEDGIEVIQSGAATEPADTIEVSLDAIVYSETGDVQLSGRANSGATVRVYLSNRAIIDAPVNAEGRWSTELPGVEPGIYTLRLDEVDETGSVLSRLETPFKREAPEVLRPAAEPEVDADQVAKAEPEQDEPTGPVVRVVTVQKGDTLWAISESRYGDGVQYVRLFEANRASIRDPDLIFPGQVFEIPE